MVYLKDQMLECGSVVNELYVPWYQYLINESSEASFVSLVENVDW